MALAIYGSHQLSDRSKRQPCIKTGQLVTTKAISNSAQMASRSEQLCRLFLGLLPCAYDTLLDSLKGRKTEHVINSATDIAQATISADVATETGASEHFAFVDGKPSETDLKGEATKALTEANIHKSQQNCLRNSTDSPLT